MSKLRCSQLPLKMLLLRGRKHWSVYTKGNLEKYLILCATSDFARKWLQTLPTSKHTLCHPLRLQHSLRVYLQVQQWKGSGGELLPVEWGWKESDRGLMPVHTDLPPAPDELLRVIKCNCQSDCSSLRCTCRKHNIKCSLACAW